ncbi:MAG: hypothetical protein ACREOR_11370, partial [Candidatus Binatia bacterium]
RQGRATEIDLLFRSVGGLTKFAVGVGSQCAKFLDLQAFLRLTWPTLFQCKDSEIAPRRRGGRGVKSFWLRNIPNSANSVVMRKNSKTMKMPKSASMKSNTCER